MACATGSVSVTCSTDIGVECWSTAAALLSCVREKLLQRLEPAGRGADPDERKWLDRRRDRIVGLLRPRFLL